MAISVRDEVLDAFRRLERRTGQSVFRLRDVVSEVLSITTAYNETTLRTYVTSVMCADAPVHHGNHTDDLIRVGHGLYTRSDDYPTPTARDLEDAGGTPPTPNPLSAVPDSPWHWEGNVQAAIVGALARSGWQIQAVTDTESRASGTDIVANLEGDRLHVEVKGYPTGTYARGDKAGAPKPTHPATQARVWFSGALLKAAMLRNDHPDDSVAIGLPDFPTYRTLADRVSATLRNSDIGMIWVEGTGDVELALESSSEQATD